MFNQYLMKNCLVGLFRNSRKFCLLNRNDRLLLLLVGNMSTASMIKPKPLRELNFDNRVLDRLPIDPIQENYIRTVKNACFSLVQPAKLKNPKLVCYSLDALSLLDLDESSIDEYFIDCFAGNEPIPGSKQAAHCYCGHQFGVFAGQLGDGAAIYLGEIVNSKNERWELQLKGAGLTPYSRDADGRKVLRSSLREFLCSEAMHHLSVPTTRAGTCIVSDDRIRRDQFYDGHPRMEQCAIVSRIAPTFLRFGSFEIFKTLDVSSGRTGPSVGRNDILTSLADFALEAYYPHIDRSLEDKYKKFFKEVVNSTAKLVAQWQAIGFVHGVLNTDNMSIMSLTLDYGPFGFMDRFDPDHIPNTSDHDGRYRFRKQPEVCFWNLLKFAEALSPLTSFDELKSILKENYLNEYKTNYIDLMLKKFGLTKRISSADRGEKNDEVVSDEDLISDFLETLDKVGGDYTNCFRNLSLLSLPSQPNHEESLEKLRKILMEQSSSHEEMKSFFDRFMKSPMVYMRLMWMQKFEKQIEENHEMVTLMSTLQYHQQVEELNSEQFEKQCRQLWNTWLESYIKRIKYEIQDFETDAEKLEAFDETRKLLMNSNNPKYILRNHLAQDAIEKAEKGDFSEAQNLLKALQDPYTERSEFDRYTERPPRSSSPILVSCSS